MTSHLLPIAQDLLPAIRAACEEAGQLALDLFRPGAQTAAKTWSKAGGSPVTEADIGVDAFLNVRLSALLPQAAWLSEETADDALRLSHRHVWVVDPIDGTRAYMAGSPDWAVCVALLDDGVPIAGIVHAPACGATYAAVRGAGSTRNGERLRTSGATELTGARIAGPKPMLDALARQHDFIQADKIPSLALRLARVADGSIDAGLVSPDSRDWDIAAADLVLSEAGGRLTTAEGGQVRYNRVDPVHGILVAVGDALAPPLEQAIARLRDSQPQRSWHLG